jgi:extracellular elastinolytic metalloproteinase
MIKNVSVFHCSLVLTAVIFSSSAFAQKSTEKLIENYFSNNAKSLGIEQLSAKDWSIDKTTSDDKRGLSFHYLQQQLNGLPVLNGTAVVVQKGETLMMTGNRFQVKTEDFPTKSTALSPEDCVNEVWKVIGSGSIVPFDAKTKVSASKTVLTNNTYSHSDIPVQLAYFHDGTSYRLVYDMSFEMKDNQNWWSIYADANTGKILNKNNWIVSCQFGGCSPSKHFNHNKLKVADMNHSLMMAPAPPPETDSYNIIPIPTESPIHGARQMVTGPFNSTASPYGWHDTDGIPGEEYTITRGNNVYASEDADNNNQPGYSPDGGSSLTFDFPLPLNSGPLDYQDAAITNLFYMNNIMHDVFYQYGFTESAGNFQQNNYGKGGNGNDYVRADAQDGSGTNNANFGTPPDGGNPRMQMYIWTPNGTPRMFYINAPETMAGRYNSGKGNFGPIIPTTPLISDLVLATDSVGNDPIDGCTQILNPAVAGKIAVIRRGGCDNALKIENCEAAGAIGVIMINNTLGDPGNFTGTPTTAINIPTLLIGLNPGSTVLSRLQNGETVNISMYDDGWSGTTDSDLDNVIIAHEYGHGISNRLTGGPNASNCLGNAEQMGEGWSDWAGLMITIEPGDLPGDKRGVGTFVRNQDTDGTGIRPTPYSNDFSVNSYTYQSTNNQSISQPHGIGFIWATMLWDLNWAFIGQYGFDADVYNGTGGNNMVMELVLNGMKFQPCGPGFVDGRDAILQADVLLNGGANQCLIWRTFANRGLGLSASQGSAGSRSDQTEAFDVPQNCYLGINETDGILNGLKVYPNPTNSALNIAVLEGVDIQSIKIIDINGRVMFEQADVNSSSFSADITDFSPGVYFVEVSLSNGMAVRKILKQ